MSWSTIQPWKKKSYNAQQLKMKVVQMDSTQDELSECYTKWIQSVTERYIIHDSAYYRIFWYTCFLIWSWRRKWQPTPVFLPGESHGRRSLVYDILIYGILNYQIHRILWLPGIGKIRKWGVINQWGIKFVKQDKEFWKLCIAAIWSCT